MLVLQISGLRKLNPLNSKDKRLKNKPLQVITNLGPWFHKRGQGEEYMGSAQSIGLFPLDKSRTQIMAAEGINSLEALLIQIYYTKKDTCKISHQTIYSKRNLYFLREIY